MKKNWILSASLITAFKSCPYRCFLKYVERLEPIEDTESQRVGNNWHRLQQIIGYEPGSVCPECAGKQKNPDCPLCEGTDILPDDLMEAIVRELDQTYAECPMGIEKDDWETERITLLYTLSGYQWYYAEQLKQFKTIATEQKFEMKLRNPETGRALPNVIIRGKIDKLIEDSNTLVKEHKSTTKSVDPDSTFWNHLNLDTQTTLYILGGRQLGYPVTGIFYDAFHRPGIKPKKLSQADSKAFVESGEYCGQKFEVKTELRDNKNCGYLMVDNAVPNIEPGKKEGTFAIRETPDMFGARLLQDITERPEFYFRCQSVPKTEKDLEQFQIELYNIYQTIKQMDKTNHWYKNEHQCEATFRCPYTRLCYNNVDINDGHTPDGFKRRTKNAETTTKETR